MRRLASAFAMLALIVPAALRAQAPATFRVGLKTIAIPAPADNLHETGSDYRVLLENLVPTSNRLVAGFLTPDELKGLQTSTSLTQYALVEVPRRAEFADVTPEIFKQINDSLATQFGGDGSGTLKTQQDELDRKLKDLGATSTVTLEKPLLLGSLFNKPDAVSYGEVMPVTVNGVTTKMVMAVNVIRVHQRVLFFYLFIDFKNEDSVKWVSATGEKWADAILAANKE